MAGSESNRCWGYPTVRVCTFFPSALPAMKCPVVSFIYMALRTASSRQPHVMDG